MPNAFLDGIVGGPQGRHTRRWYQNNPGANPVGMPRGGGDTIINGPQGQHTQRWYNRAAQQAQQRTQQQSWQQQQWAKEQQAKEEIHQASLPPPGTGQIPPPPPTPNIPQPQIPVWKAKPTGPWQSIGTQAMPEQTQRWNPITGQFEYDSGGGFKWDTTTGTWSQY